jgi:hypothetical protein
MNRAGRMDTLARTPGWRGSRHMKGGDTANRSTTSPEPTHLKHTHGPDS